MTLQARVFQLAAVLCVCLNATIFSVGGSVYAQTPLTSGIALSAADSFHLFSIDPSLLSASWTVIGVRSPVEADYDLPLFSDTAGTVQVTVSAQNGAAIDFDVINFHNTPLAPYYPAVVSRGGAGTYWAEWSHAQDTIPVGAYGGEKTWNANEVVRVFEFHAMQSGSQPLTVVRTGGDGDFGIGVFSLTTAPFAAGRAAALAEGMMSGNAATVTFAADTATWYGVVVWSNNGAAGTFRVGNMAAPSITVTSPNGGENWNSASNHAITWTATGLTGRAALQINRDYPAGAWTTIFDTTTTLGSYTWTVTNPGTLTGRMRVISDLFPFIGDTSDANFTISGVAVFSPNGGENWTIGSVHDITWAGVGFTGTVTVSVNRTYPTGSWTTLFNNTTNDSIQSWTVSGPTTSTARIRVRSSTTTSISDFSDANFTISPTPSLTLTVPNGGESWEIGTTYNIKWTRVNVSGQVILDMDRNYPSGTWETISDSTANDSIYAWLVTGPETAAARVRIRSMANPAIGDTSNTVFTIATFVPPSITVIAPNGAENWMVGSTHSIMWTSFDISSGVRIQLNRGYPAGTWETVADSTANTGSFAWIVTDTASTTCRVRIISATDGTIGDTSNANFTIGAQQIIALTSPNGGEIWYSGTVHPITWTSQNVTGNVAIDVNRTYPTGTWNTVSPSTANTGSYNWTVTTPTTTTARIRVRSLTASSIRDSSDGNFTIALPPGVTVRSPNGGEDWMIGTVHSITWSRVSAPGNVTIELMRDYPSGTWESIADNAAYDTSYSWTVTGPETSTARIRVRTMGDTAYADTSNQNFAISAFQTILVTSPNGGESWVSGSQHNISWVATGFTSDVQIQIKTSYPSGSWTTIAGSAANTGSYLWTITQSATSTARIRIRQVGNTSISDTSNANFTITSPTITVTSPNGGEILAIDSACAISWASVGVTGAVTVDMNRTYPAGTWDVLADSVTNSGSFAWTVTGPTSTTTRFRVRWRSVPAIGDTSDAAVVISGIAPIALSLLSPNGGDTWTIGSVHPIVWTAWGVTGLVHVQINRSYPSTIWETISDSAAAAGPYLWTVSDPATNAARIRIFSSGDSTIGDTSNLSFSVVTPIGISITSPNGGETWWTGSVYAITWTSVGFSGNVAIEINRNYPGAAWNVLSGNTANSGTLDWTVSGAVTSNARIRVRSLENTAVADTSDANFAVAPPPSIVIHTPNGGENWYIGSSHLISWSVTSINDRLAIEINRSYPAGAWEMLADMMAGDTILNWTANGQATPTARIRVRSQGTTAYADTSDGDFTLQAMPSITVISPNGGETFVVGSTDTIRWMANNFTGNVAVYLNRDYPVGGWSWIGSATMPTTSVAMMVTGPGTLHARVKAVWASDSTISDISDADFSIIQPALTLLHPNGREVLRYQQVDTIRWTRTAAPGGVRVEWDPAYPSGWQTLGESGGDSLVWTPNVESQTARVRIWLLANAAISDSSDSNFVVTALNVQTLFGNIPTRYTLAAIYPNPFNPITQVVVGVPHSGHIAVRVFDILGQEVAKLYDGNATAGYTRLIWNASGCASGMYVVSFEAQGFVERRTIRYLR